MLDSYPTQAIILIRGGTTPFFYADPTRAHWRNYTQNHREDNIMGALPKRKISKARRDRRRTHDNIKTLNLFACADADGMHIPHALRRAVNTKKGRKMLGLDA